MVIRQNFIKRVAVLLAAALICVPAWAEHPELEAEIQHYKKAFESGNFEAQHDAIGQITWTGISDERVFDVLAEVLKKETDQPPDAREDRSQELAWFAKALGISGNEKYRPLLQKLTESTNSTISRHSENALQMLNEYSEWNPIIAKNIEQAPVGKLGEWRATNMLESSDPALIRVGAKRIYYHYQGHPELTAIAAKVLKDGYRDPQDDLLEDALAWICKAISTGRDPQYVKVLEIAAKQTHSRQVRRHCEQSWKELRGKVGEPSG